MSDISGPPAPKPVQSVTHGTERTAAASKDPKHSGNPTTDEKGEQRAQQDPRNPLQAREPAVSIAATAAHLRVGEELQAPVVQTTPEGRPIIETETATFVVKPTAGLKPGDTVVLNITETGKQLTADLTSLNDKPVKPTINVQLVVISIHNSQATPSHILETGKEAPAAPVNTLLSNVPYKPSIVLRAPISGLADINLSQVSSASDKPAANIQTTFNEQSPIESRPPADNPDHAIIRTSSQDLATLLSAQQVKTQTTSLSTQDILPPVAKAVINYSPEGLGPKVSAITLSGTSVTLQAVSPSNNNAIAGNDVTKIVTQSQLSAADISSLTTSTKASINAEQLVKLQTTKGDFIVSDIVANSLQGQIVKISQTIIQQPAPIPEPQNNNLPQYSAQLIAPNAQHTRQVTVQLPNTPVTAPTAVSTTVEITAVHTLRAFLSSTGPKSDLRLETELGDIKLSVENNIRLSAGDLISIINKQSAQPVLDTNSAATQAAALIPSPTGSWPNFQEAYSILAQTAPDAANDLASKTASSGAKVTNSLLFLMSALKGSGADAWLGNKVETALEQSNKNILEALKSDIGRLLATAGETIGDWRTFVIPTDPRGDMPLIALLFGQQATVDPDDNNRQNNADADDKKKSDHFILEVVFSILGAVQLDGYISPQKFDLTVRSHNPLPQELERDTQLLFSNALAANNYTGGLSFITEDTFPVSAVEVLASKT